MTNTTRYYLDQFNTILLDMNSTFMFGEDRFGEDEDFFSTYRRLGGVRLDRIAVNAAIRRCYEAMLRDYHDPAKVDDFPSLAEGLRQYASVDDIDIPDLEAVFAYHERGYVPDATADCLKRLHRSHRLGVVSNIWAKKALWLKEFERVGIHSLWHTMIFSSDRRSIKPAPALFLDAMAACEVQPCDVVFVGDSLRLDVEPAKSLGLATVWLTDAATTHPLADRAVRSLLELERLPA